MGVVVSGEDGNSGISNEQRKINLIAAENDYGLFVATLDRILVFIGSWWTSSLAGRVQVRRVPDLLKTTEIKSVCFADVSLISRRSEAIRRCHWRTSFVLNVLPWDYRDSILLEFPHGQYLPACPSADIIRLSV